MPTWWGGGTGANPAAEADYFKRVIGAGDVTPFNGLFFNDPANDQSKRTWYDANGMVVPGYGTGGPAGPGAGGGGSAPGSIEQIMGDMTLQRMSKAFNWTGDSLPTIKSFGGGGYWWSKDPHTFDVPQPIVHRPAIQNIVQQMVQAKGGGKAPPGSQTLPYLLPQIGGGGNAGNPQNNKKAKDY